MRKKRGLALIGLAVLAVAAVLLTMQQHWMFDPTPMPIHHEQQVGDLLYVIDLEKDTFKRGERITVDAAVTNLGDVPLQYVSGSSSCPVHVSLDISRVDSDKPIHLANAPLGHGCTTDLVSSSLEPNQSVSYRSTFLTQYWKMDLKPAPPGTYNVEFKMSRAGEEFFAIGKPQPEEKFAGSSFPIRIR